MKTAFKILAVVVILLGIAYLSVGYVIYDKLTQVVPYPERMENKPSDFLITYEEVDDFDTTPYLVPAYEEVSFNSRQGEITLSGWYLEADPGAPAVIVTHGIGAAKHAGNALLVAGMIYKNGFNVLIFDLRNHGASGVDDGRTSIGNKEYLDVLGAWDYLVEERGFSPERVGLFGLSLGGASTLNGFAEEPRVAAIVVDSPFANLQQIISEEMVRTGYPTFLVPAGIISARLVDGVDLLEHTPMDAIRLDAGRPIFIIHGLADKRINVHHTRDLMALAEQTGANAEAWYVDGADHVMSEYLQAAEYEKKLAAFYREALDGQPK
jgi:uncharacterized protein